MDGTLLNKKYRLEKRVAALEEGGGGGGLPDYSTTEQLTGQKWIDGKDIYFKVVVLESPVDITYNQWYTSNVDASNISSIINAESLNADGACCPLIAATNNSVFIFLGCRVDSAFAAKIIILTYTKNEVTSKKRASKNKSE